MQSKDEIRNQIPHAYVVPCGDKFGFIGIEAIWVDNQNEVTVDGAIWSPSGTLICTFTNSKISPTWIPEENFVGFAK